MIYSWAATGQGVGVCAGVGEGAGGVAVPCWTAVKIDKMILMNCTWQRNGKPGREPLHRPLHPHMQLARHGAVLSCCRRSRVAARIRSCATSSTWPLSPPRRWWWKISVRGPGETRRARETESSSSSQPCVRICSEALWGTVRHCELWARLMKLSSRPLSAGVSSGLRTSSAAKCLLQGARTWLQTERLKGLGHQRWAEDRRKMKFYLLEMT